MEGFSSPRSLPSRPTPSKGDALAQFRGHNGTSKALKPSGTPESSRRLAWNDSALPTWVPPTVRFLCKEHGHDRLAPIVLAGMESIVAPQGRRSTDDWITANVTGLLAAIYFYASKNLESREGGETGLEAAQYKVAEKAILLSLRKARGTVVVKGADDEEAWEGWSDVERKRFRDALVEVSERKWLESDWFRAIDNLRATDEQNDTAYGTIEGGTSESSQIVRADSMFQDKYDFLSEKRRAEYRKWSAEMLRTAEERDRNTAPTAMEVDT
jgi:origin recognition complex subunit 6